MMRSIFIKRPGRSAMQVRVFHSRPKQRAALRGMRRRGLPCHVICTHLGISRVCYDQLIATAQFFYRWP